MGFKESFLAFAVEHGLIDADDKNKKPETAAAADTNQPQTAAEIEAANNRAAAAEKQLADLKAEQEQKHQAQIKTDAENFVAAEIKAGRMFPAEKEKFQSLYLQAAADDAANPLAEGSRLGNLKAIQENRKPHGLTSELLDPKAGLKNLSADDDETTKIERGAENQAKEYVGAITPHNPNLKAVK